MRWFRLFLNKLKCLTIDVRKIWTPMCMLCCYYIWWFNEQPKSGKTDDEGPISIPKEFFVAVSHGKFRMAELDLFMKCENVPWPGKNHKSISSQQTTSYPLRHPSCALPLSHLGLDVCEWFDLCARSAVRTKRGWSTTLFPVHVGLITSF